jgi:hypothetical protein
VADGAGQSRPLPTLFGLGLGMLLGFTLVVDLTAAPACLLAGVLTLALASRRGTAAVLRITLFLLLGGFLGLLPLLVYDQLAFGSPFTLGYSTVVGFEGMQQGFFGIGWPKPRVLVSILFGRYRGLLPLSPVLVLVPVGLYAMLLGPDRDVGPAGRQPCAVPDLRSSGNLRPRDCQSACRFLFAGIPDPRETAQVVADRPHLGAPVRPLILL